MAYSQENLLLKSVRKILKADTADTGESVREIAHYVSNRIYRSYAWISNEFNHLTMHVVGGPQEINLPNKTYMLHISGFYIMKSPSPQDNLGKLTQRILDLIDQKHVLLNENISEPLRCRLIVNLSNSFLPLVEDKLFQREMIFRVICDKEITNV